MNNNVTQIVEKKNSSPAANQSQLGNMLTGRISRSNNDTTSRKSDADFDSMLKSTAPEMKNSGELTFIPLDVLLPFPGYPFKLYQGTKLNDLVKVSKKLVSLMLL